MIRPTIDLKYRRAESACPGGYIAGATLRIMGSLNYDEAHEGENSSVSSVYTSSPISPFPPLSSASICKQWSKSYRWSMLWMGEVIRFILFLSTFCLECPRRYIRKMPSSLRDTPGVPESKSEHNRTIDKFRS